MKKIKLSILFVFILGLTNCIFSQNITFKVRKKSSDYKAVIAGVSNGSLSKSVFLAAEKIEVIPKNEEAYIISYTFVIGNGDLIEIKCKSDLIPKKAKDIIRTSKKGSKIYIEDIKARNKTETRTLQPITIILK